MKTARPISVRFPGFPGSGQVFIGHLAVLCFDCPGNTGNIPEHVRAGGQVIEISGKAGGGGAEQL